MAEQQVILEPSESSVVTFEATPHEAKTYQVSVDGLTGSFRAIAVPNIKLSSLTWDATPPFKPASRHYWTVNLRNLAAGRLIYQLEMYMNGVLFQGYTANLDAGEVREYSQPYTFGTEGTYILTIKAYYEGKLLDQISATVTVAVPVEELIDAEYLVGYVKWDGWRPNPVMLENEWPANTDITLLWLIRNTGTVGGYFRVYMSRFTEWVYLEPGQQAEVYEKTHSPSPQTTTHRITLSGGKTIAEERLIWDAWIGVTYT